MSTRLLGRKLGGRVSSTIETLCSPVGEFVQRSIRQQNRIGVQESKCLALAWLRRFHQQHQQDLVRHLFLVNRLLDGLVLEWTSEDEELLGTRRGDPAHQATWEASMVTGPSALCCPGVRRRIVLVGDALGVWFGMVKFCARAGKINEIAKEVAMHLAPLGHELVGVHIWSEANTLADGLSRVAELGVMLEGLVNARHELLARRDAEKWKCLRHLKDNL